MKAIAALAIFVLCASALSEREYQSAFTSWMQTHGKSYNHDDFQVRYQVFRSNLDFINQHNAEGHSYTVAMNHLGDLTSEEYRTIMLGTKIAVNPTVSEPSTADPSLPDSMDWRTKGAVTPVKNQGQCGSCWSFSTTGSTEGCHQITTGKLVGLSEQNLMDCSVKYGNQGCNGGLMTSAMQYIIDNKGIDTEASYPYTTSGPNQCQYSDSNRGATLSSYTNVVADDENDLQAKAAIGPVSVAIDASQSSFQFYSSGVYNEPACSSTQLDHGVLVAGWGSDSGTDYWLVKNSWGTSWGQAGYIWMSRNRNNQCGIASMATLPHC